MTRRSKPALALAGGAAVLLAAAQLLLPLLAEREIEERLTEGGGDASAEVSALPAPRLLLGDGDRIEVRGSDLVLDLPAEDRDALERLDGFDSVDIALTDVLAGPFEVHRFALARDGDAPYGLRMRARITAASVAAYGATRLGGGPLAAGFGAAFLGNAVPEPLEDVPIRADLRLRSDGGEVVTTGGRATVEGYDVTPFAALVTRVVAARI